MLVAYDSLTGNVRRFTEKLPFERVKVTEDLQLDEPFIVVTYTVGFGQPPKIVNHFLERNHLYLKGVAASGNKNWGNCFAGSADVIAQKYCVPLLLKFEMAGTAEDVRLLAERVKKIDDAYRVKQ